MKESAMIGKFVLDHLQPPYLIVRVVPRMFHVTALPTAMEPEEMAAVARTQASANRFDTCLVSSTGRRYFVTEPPLEEGSVPRRFDMLNHWSAVPACSHLQASAPFPPTEQLTERETLLARLVGEYQQVREAFMRERRWPIPAPYVYGDFTKGGRDPSAADHLALTGGQPPGGRIGLDRCSVCGDWRGECLDEIELIGTRVVPVHCRCDNENSCARCGQRLAERRLNGNYYEESTDTIWHLPGIAGFKHACHTVSGSALQSSGGPHSPQAAAI